LRIGTDISEKEIRSLLHLRRMILSAEGTIAFAKNPDFPKSPSPNFWMYIVQEAKASRALAIR
jgi:hypothetical protein